MTRYRLPDEPRPGALRQVVVKPLWPLFAIMTGGALLSWVWFIVNGWALGSPTRVRETLIALGGLVGTVALLGPEGWDQLVLLFWLMFVAYTWFAPAIFQRRLEAELAPVTLKKDF